MNTIPVRSGKANICKFLLLEDGTLLFGYFEEHRKLWSAYCSSIGKQEDAFERPLLSGAGIVLFSGEIFDWESIRYGMVTPYDIRPKIEAFFAKQSDLLFEMYHDAGN